MQTYYCVISSFDDDGRATAALINQGEFEEKPASDFRSTSTKDIYIDWFESLAEAKQFIADTKRA